MRIRSIDLKNLLSDIIKVSDKDNCTITGLAIDSRQVCVGDLFLAYCGENNDGRNYINNAVERGAAAILCDDPLPQQINLVKSVPILSISKLREKVGLIAAKFYDYPSKKMMVIGVTGTNGKTSCTQFLAEILTAQQQLCGVIGTLGAGFFGKLSPLNNTTPDAVTLQRLLYEFYQQNAKAVAMEVSSHSLEQGRISGINFDAAIFTNLTREHLDYHGNMDNYGLAKKKLFLQPNLHYAIINADDEFGQSLIKELSGPVKVYAYSTKNISTIVPTISATDIKLDINGVSAKVITPWGDGYLRSALLGHFNVSNLLAVLTVLGIYGIKLDVALKSFESIHAVPGRMQKFGGGKKSLIVVDYAHSPDALEQTLLTMREHCHGALWCVFGCGGNRDKGKRAIMGQIAERYSDHIIITNDNPRTENPQKIIDDILQGLLCPWAAEVEQDRRAAIAHAVDCAQPDDAILIAGKGHENYQIIGKEKIPFSDVEVVKSLV